MTALPDRDESARIGSLDGLRAIAILLVMLSHFVTGVDPNRGLRSIAYKVIVNGWCGVDLFFVLSGFLITGILIRARESKDRFRNFYARRTLRIFPLYYLALLIVFLIVPAVAGGCPPVPSREQMPYWLYIANFRLRDVASPCSNVGHFWSLAIEEQYYAVWPAVVFLLTPRNAKRACIAIIAASVLFRIALVMQHAQWRAFYWTPSRADALSCGSLIAFLMTTEQGRAAVRKWSWPLFIIAGAITAALMWKNRLETIFSADESMATLVARVGVPFLLAALFAAFVGLALTRPVAARVLDNPPFRFLARYSYGLYVWHMFVIYPAHLLMPSGPVWPRAIAELAATLIAATLSYHLFEERFLALKRYFPQRHS